MNIHYPDTTLSYVDDMVLLAPTVTALQTILEVCRLPFLQYTIQNNYPIFSRAAGQ